jgi:outer membrane beta-barrel protein
MLLSLLTATTAFAVDPVDIGVIKDSDLRVVQKVLYTKEKRLELGAHLGVMPFDPFTIAPTLAITGTEHFTEHFAGEVHVGGGYGFKNGQYKLLEGPTFGVAYEAYRYLADVEADVQWSPVYGKINFGNGKIVHHDAYVLAGAGLTVEQSVLPTNALAFAPSIPIGIGTRVFLSPDVALRLELRDSVMYEVREQSATSGIKQDIALSVGVVKFGKGK